MRRIVIKAQTPFFQIDLRELVEFRWVFFMLILRDIKLRYNQTVLGVGWVVLQPLMTALLFSLIFGRIMHMPSEGVPYMVFAFCGLVPWIFFSQSLQRASLCLINDSRLITKTYFPRIFIPLSATFGVVIDFLITLSLAMALISYNGLSYSSNLMFLPLCTLVLFLFTCGLNLILSALNVYYRDLKHILPFVVQLWMYASPLVYSGSLVPEKYHLIYSLNPLAGIIDAFRFSLLGLDTFPTFSFSISAVLSVLFVAVGTLIFRKIEHYFADRI